MIGPRLQEAEDRMASLLLNIGFQIGGIVQTLQSQKTQLVHANANLSSEIEQLSRANAAELNTVVAQFSAKLQRVASQIQKIQAKLNHAGLVFQKQQFVLLQETIDSVNIEIFKNYPVLADVPNDFEAQQLDIPLILTNNDPVITKYLVSYREHFHQLKDDIEKLQNENHVLKQKKDRMNDYHSRYIREVKDDVINIQYQKMVQILKNIDITIEAPDTIFESYTPTTASVIETIYLKDMDKEKSKVIKCFEKLIFTLENKEMQ